MIRISFIKKRYRLENKYHLNYSISIKEFQFGDIMNILTKSRLQTLFATVIGSFLFSIGLNCFIVPYNFTSGGISGILILLYYLVGLPIGLGNVILNIPIVYLAYKFLGRWQVILTVLGMLIISFAIDTLQFMRSYMLVHDPILAAIISGILTGIGLGIIYRFGGNTGGLDPIAFIIKKFYGLQIGSVSFAINTAILVAASFITSIELAAISLITLYIQSVIINKIIIGFNQRKAVYIISYKADQICDCILKGVGRGATILHGEGAYTHKPKQVILAVVNLMQVTKLKNLVAAVDPSAFMLITDTSEVIGQGFTFSLQERMQYNIPEGEKIIPSSEGNVILPPPEQHEDLLHKLKLKK